jgi:hypothetical protein
MAGSGSMRAKINHKKIKLLKGYVMSPISVIGEILPILGLLSADNFIFFLLEPLNDE